MSSPVENIKERLSIVDVISSYITLIPSGVNYKAKCPFHNEKTPSFFISTERNSYYCFGCSAKGDIFSFVQNFEGVDFKGALKTLAERAGVPLVYNNQDLDSKDILFEIMEKATLYFETQFANTPTARAYLISRGLNDETIKSFRVGYAPDGWRNLSDHLTKMGYKQKDLDTVGLIKISEKGMYDRFRSRIMFPISDSSGRVIAFSGRLFGKEDDKEAKYLNSPDTILFNKSNVLFGIDKAKLDIRKRGYAIIVEGQMDLLLSHQVGCTNTLAVSGTALASSVTDAENTINNLGLIRRLSTNVIFAFDGDSAGVRAVGRSALIALSLDMQVKIAVLPEGKDPADVIASDQNEWKRILTNAKHIVTFYIDRICDETPDQRIRGRKIREVVFPYIKVLKSAIEQSAYIKEITTKTNIPENAINIDFELFKKEQPVQVQNENSDKFIIKDKSRRSKIEARLFGIIFKQEETAVPDENIKKVVDEFKDLVGDETYNELVKNNLLLKDILAMETEMWYGKEINTITLDVSELALNLAEDIYQEKADNILYKISKYDKDTQKNEIEECLKEYQQIINTIHSIKNRRTK